MRLKTRTAIAASVGILAVATYMFQGPLGLRKLFETPDRFATTLWSTPLSEPGSGYGGTCATLADCDGDGLCDVAVTAADLFRPDARFVDIVSAADGRSLRRLEPPHWVRAFGQNLLPPRDSETPFFIASGSLVFRYALPTEGADSAGHEVQLGPGGRDWQTSIVAVGDVDGDGADDFVVGTGRTAKAGKHGSVYLATSRDRDGGWRIEGEPSELLLGKGLVAVHDLDDDGYDDVAALGNGLCTLVSVRSGRRLTTLHGESWFGCGPTGISTLSCGDLTGDSVPDICIGDPTEPGADESSSGTIHVIDGATLRESRRIAGPPDVAAFGTRVLELGDIDRDGVTDLCVVGSSARSRTTVSLVSGETGAILGTGAFGQPGEMLLSTCVVDDVDGDGVPDVVFGQARFTEGPGPAPQRMRGYATLISLGSLRSGR